MGCCFTTYNTPTTEAARLIRSTFPDFTDMRAEITVRGAYGYPFRCKDGADDVFVKVTHVREYTRRALQELSLRKPKQCLVPIKYRISGDKAVVVYPWVDGGDLLKHVNQFITNARKERLIKSLLQAVYEIHRHGLAHRDIKLENILVQRDTCILIDTDTCESATRLYYTGTANYLPPTPLVHRVLRHPGIARSEKMFWLDCYALGKLLSKILLVGSVHPDERRIWDMWVDRERASPSAVRVLLTQRRSTPWWKYVYWWCVENEQQLLEEQPYIKGMDEVMSELGYDIPDM